MRILSAFILISFLSISSYAKTELINLPITLPEAQADEDRLTIVDPETKKSALLTIEPYLQHKLTSYIRNHGNPIAAAVVVDAKNGKILAMVQGRHPKEWEGTTHSALHAHFPAASLFKTVVAGAAFELTDIDPEYPVGLYGGCATVRPTGVWLQDETSSRHSRISLRKAYGQSCNGFFAKLSINTLGLNALISYAKRFGWDGNIKADFNFERSPMSAPQVRASSVHAVGRYAAGFGYVGISAVHAAWQTLAIANNGLKLPLRIQAEGPVRNSQAPLVLSARDPNDILLTEKAAKSLKQIMSATIQGGTASFAFRRGKYRALRNYVGGKTGTLSGKAPKGVTTWFTGMMPREDPEIVVAAVVVLEDLWHIKGPNLAAEAFYEYQRMHRQNLSRVAHSN